MARQSSARERGRNPGLLARLFCFAPQAHARVNAIPRGASSKVSRAVHASGEPQLGAAGTAAVSGSPPSTPSSAAAFAAYLGSVAPPATPGRDDSAELSVLQASSAYGSGSLGFVGSGSGGPSPSAAAPDDGYDADSDCPPLHASSPPRFRPTLRHPRGEVYGGVAADGELGGGASQDLGGAFEEGMGSGGMSRETSGHDVGAGVSDIIHNFERIFMKSGSGSSRTRREAGATETAETAVGSGSARSQPGSSGSVGGSAGRRPTDNATPASQHSRGSSMSLSGSISLFHFMGGAVSRTSRTSRSGNSRRLAAALPGPYTPASATSSATRTSSRRGGAPVVVASGPLPPASMAEGGQAPPQGTVQRRLTEVQNGHYISLEKLRTQCGDFSEPPGDLLSLMARRVFANRSSLLQRPSDEGRLSDMQAADDSRLHTPSQDTGTVTSPRSPPPPPPPARAVPAQQEAQQAQQEGEQEVALPTLPRIRTRMDQRRAGPSTI